jgi:hypothetical protein
VTIYALAQPDRFNTFFPSREALALPNLVSVGQRHVVSACASRVRRTVAIEDASMQILRKPAQSFVQPKLDRTQPHD